MIQATTGIPLWLQYAWAVAGTTMLFLALVWTLCIFWPYIRFTKRLMLMNLDMGRETLDQLRGATKVADHAERILGQAEKLLGQLEDIAAQEWIDGKPLRLWLKSDLKPAIMIFSERLKKAEKEAGHAVAALQALERAFTKPVAKPPANHKPVGFGDEAESRTGRPASAVVPEATSPGR